METQTAEVFNLSKAVLPEELGKIQMESRNENGCEDYSTPSSSSFIPSFENITIKVEPLDDYETNPSTNTNLDKKTHTNEVVEIGEVIHNIKKEESEITVINLCDESDDSSQVNVLESKDTNLTCASDNLKYKNHQSQKPSSFILKDPSGSSRNLNLTPHVGPVFDLKTNVRTGTRCAMNGMQNISSPDTNLIGSKKDVFERSAPSKPFMNRATSSNRKSINPNPSATFSSNLLFGCSQFIRQGIENISDLEQQNNTSTNQNKKSENLPMETESCIEAMQNRTENSVQHVENVNFFDFKGNSMYNVGKNRLQTNSSSGMKRLPRNVENTTAQNRKARRKIPKKKIQRLCVLDTTGKESTSEIPFRSEMFPFSNGMNNDISTSVNNEVAFPHCKEIKNLSNKIATKTKVKKQKTSLCSSKIDSNSQICPDSTVVEGQNYKKAIFSKQNEGCRLEMMQTPGNSLHPKQTEITATSEGAGDSVSTSPVNFNITRSLREQHSIGVYPSHMKGFSELNKQTTKKKCGKPQNSLQAAGNELCDFFKRFISTCSTDGTRSKFSFTNVLSTPIWNTVDQVIESNVTSGTPAPGQLKSGPSDDQTNQENEISEPVSDLSNTALHAPQIEDISSASNESLPIESNVSPTNEIRRENGSESLVQVSKNNVMTNNILSTSNDKNELEEKDITENKLSDEPSTTFVRYSIRTLDEEVNCSSIYSAEVLREFLPSENGKIPSQDENNVQNSSSVELKTSDKSQRCCAEKANNIPDRTFPDQFSKEKAHYSLTVNQDFNNNGSVLNSSERNCETFLDSFNDIELLSDSTDNVLVMDTSSENKAENDREPVSASVSEIEGIGNFLSDTVLQNNSLPSVNSEIDIQSINIKLIKTSNEGEFFYTQDTCRFYLFNTTNIFITMKSSETWSNVCNNSTSKFSAHGNSVSHLNNRSENHGHYQNINNLCEVLDVSCNQIRNSYEVPPTSASNVINNSGKSSKLEFNILILEMHGNNADGFGVRHVDSKSFVCENFWLSYEFIDLPDVERLMNSLESVNDTEVVHPRTRESNNILYFWPALAYNSSSLDVNLPEERISLPSESQKTAQILESHIFIGLSNLPVHNVIEFVIANSKFSELFQKEMEIPTSNSYNNHFNVLSTLPTQRDTDSVSVIYTNLCNATEIKKEIVNEDVIPRTESSTLSTWVNGVNVTSDENITNQDDSNECIILDELCVSGSSLKSEPTSITARNYLKDTNTANDVCEAYNSNQRLNSETAESLLLVNSSNYGNFSASSNSDINNYSIQRTSLPVSRIKEEISKDIRSQSVLPEERFNEQIIPQTYFNYQYPNSQQIPMYSNNNFVFNENVSHSVNNFVMLHPNQISTNSNNMSSSEVAVQNSNLNSSQCNRTVRNFSDTQLRMPHSGPNIALHQPLRITNQAQWRASHQIKNCSENQFRSQRYMENQTALWAMDEINNKVARNSGRNPQCSVNEFGVDRSFLQTSGGNIVRENAANIIKYNNFHQNTNLSAVASDKTSCPSRNVCTYPPPIGLFSEPSSSYQPLTNHVNLRNQNISVHNESMFNALNTSLPKENAVMHESLSAHSGRIPNLSNKLHLNSSRTGSCANTYSSSMLYGTTTSTTDELYSNEKVTNQPMAPSSYETVVQHQSHSKDNQYVGGLFSHTNHMISELPATRYHPYNSNFPNNSFLNIQTTSSSEVENEDRSKINQSISTAIQNRDVKKLESLIQEVDRLNDTTQSWRIKIHLALNKKLYEECIKIIQHSITFPPVFHKELQIAWIQAWEQVEFKEFREWPKKTKERHPYPDSIFIDSMQVLNDVYKNEKYPTLGRRQTIANLSGLTEKQVNTWFKNRRQRARKEELSTGMPSPSGGRRGRRRSVIHPMDNKWT
ncbi:homeobox domain-containing protein [Nephila pilipes]|uniref:Homeobox domain-containing protein n=1 Tax=Nephila pilipes TaxID=299642 RepID=A0A8X6NT14_NEPPI|nr:homeobox domain-containing protein [Nephila pilipes]